MITEYNIFTCYNIDPVFSDFVYIFFCMTVAVLQYQQNII